MENNLPPLTILVVNDKTKLPGLGFIATDRDKIEEATKKVYEYDWSKIKNPFDIGLKRDEIIKKIRKKKLTKEDQNKIDQRCIGQQLFREALLEIYSSKCCICGLSLKELLQAAHIKAYIRCSEDEKFDKNNGLLLCANHHLLYDSNKINISNEYIININDKIKNTLPNNDFIIKYNNKKIMLPKSKLDYPDPKYINERNKT